jgi:hypothetical protein
MLINGELTDFDFSAGVCAVQQSIAPLKPSVVGYLTVRWAGAAVRASQPAEYHARTQLTTPPRPADRITALAGSVDLFGFAPFLSPVMFLTRIFGQQ